MYKLPSADGGLTCFVDYGVLCYEYNLFLVERTQIRASTILPVVKAQIEIEATRQDYQPEAHILVKQKGNDRIAAEGELPGPPHWNHRQ